MQTERHTLSETVFWFSLSYCRILLRISLNIEKNESDFIILVAPKKPDEIPYKRKSHYPVVEPFFLERKWLFENR